MRRLGSKIGVCSGSQERRGLLSEHRPSRQVIFGAAGYRDNRHILRKWRRLENGTGLDVFAMSSWFELGLGLRG